MSGVQSGGIYFNTESGLSPFLDRLTGLMDQRAQSDAQLQGLAPALRSQGIPVSSGSGGILGMLGIGGGGGTTNPPGMPIASTSPHVSGSNASPAVYRGPAPGFDSAVSRTLGFEGGFAPHDANGAPVNMGINQAANPDVDVSKLTQDQAKALYKSRYWDTIGADDLSPALSRAAFDTSVIAGPARARQFLAQSGGDAQKFMDLREQFQNGLLQSDPEKYGRFGQAWADRNKGLRLDIAALNGGFDASRVAGGVADTAAPTEPAAKPLPGGIPREALGAMISNPASRQIGLKLWEQSVTGKDYGFSITPDGTVIRTDPRTGTATPVYQAPVKQEFKELNGRLLAADPQSGTARDATPAGMPQGYRWATPDERKAAGVQDGAPLYIGPGGKPGTLNSGTNVTLNNAVDPIQKAAGDRFDRSLTAADAAAKSIPALRTARQQLDAGIFSGALAGEKLGLQKLAQGLGLPGADASRIVNTETFKAAVGPVVLQTVKGLGAGAGISNADRDFAERMAGGNIEMNEGSIRRMLDIQERAALATIQQHQTLVDQLQQSPAGAAAYKNIGPAMRVAAPAGVTKTIGGTTYHQGSDGHWYTGQ